MDRVRYLFSIFLVLGFAITTFSQEEKKISEVEIKGLLTVRENYVKNKLRTRAGKIFSPDLLRQDIQKLHQLGLFSHIETRITDTSFGRKVTFIVSENQRIGQIKVFGNEHFDTGEILKETRVGKEKYLANYSLSLDKLNLKEKYQKEGYLFVEVKTKLVPSGGWVDVYFIIDEGPQVTIAEVNFYGNKSYKDSDLLGFMQTKTSGVFSSYYYDESKFQEDLLLVRNFYRSEGYLDVQVEMRDTMLTNDRTQMTINVKVVEGPRYYVSKVEVKGNVLFRLDEIDYRLKLKEGLPFKQNDMLLDKGQIQRLYAENGYLNVKVLPKVTIPDLDSHKVHLVYEVSEGSITYVNLLKFKGNTATKDYVMRREATILPGERFNIAKVEQTQQRLRRLAFFESIKMDLGETEEDAWKDIITTVEEGRTGNLRFAAGITSDLGAIGEISVQKRNFDITRWPTSFGNLFDDAFTGAGQQLDVNFQGGKDVLRFRVSFTEPYFLGYNLIFGTSLFRQLRVRESFDEERTGVKLTLGKRLARDVTLKFGYRFENVDIDADNDAPQDAIDVDGSNILSGLSVDFTIDTRDDFILPGRGYIFGVSYELVGLLLGGDHDFSQIDLRAAWFHTLFRTDGGKHILSLGAKIGLAFPHADTDNVPIFERFFAGGSNSIRGFEFRTVSPIDAATGDPLGGEYMVVSTIEYSYPIYEDTLRGVIFSDMGNVVPEVGDNIIDTWRISVGFGFRLKIPIFGPRPFAFDFGFPIQSEDDDDEQVFSFSFGKPF